MIPMGSDPLPQESTLRLVEKLLEDPEEADVVGVGKLVVRLLK